MHFPTVRDRLLGIVERAVGPGTALPEPFPDHARLVDIGVTSLKMVNLMLSVEVEFDITIPETDISVANFESLAAIEALVERLLGSMPAG